MVVVVALLLVCAAIASAVPVPTHVRFDGHQVLRITPQTEVQEKALQDLRWNHTVANGLDWWLEPSYVGRRADVRVPPSAMSFVDSFLSAAGMSSSVMIANLQALVEGERSQLKAAKADRKVGRGFNLDEYHELDEILNYLELLPVEYPGLVTLLPIGKSYEGRQILAVKISTGASNTSNLAKPAFWIDGGIHAREWISPATVLYILTELLAQYGSDPVVTKVVNELDIYILPVFNVDGYVYTWETNRMWRKTRSPNRGSTCVGTDPNRNFDNHWGEVGASGDPCDETFYGPSAFSEVETRAVSDYLKRIPNLSAYYNIHSYSQLYLSPWGWTPNRPPNYPEHMDLMTKSVAALKGIYGTDYEFGPSSTTIYPTSGGTDDWTYGNLNVVHSYCIELRDTGKYGFLLPVDQILPTGSETFAAIKVAMEYILPQRRV